MKLLLAEDEVDMSEALVDILTYHKYTVDAIFDGEEALDYATIGEYDGIILDIMMPKMSGLEVLQKLRSRGDRTPVLLLTAKAEVEDRIAGLDMGADDYLPKPFAMGELLARIRAIYIHEGLSVLSDDGVYGCGCAALQLCLDHRQWGSMGAVSRGRRRGRQLLRAKLRHFLWRTL